MTRNPSRSQERREAALPHDIAASRAARMLPMAMLAVAVVVITWFCRDMLLGAVAGDATLAAELPLYVAAGCFLLAAGAVPAIVHAVDVSPAHGVQAAAAGTLAAAAAWADCDCAGGGASLMACRSRCRRSALRGASECAWGKRPTNVGAGAIPSSADRKPTAAQLGLPPDESVALR
jgi:hypothetical protein